MWQVNMVEGFRLCVLCVLMVRARLATAAV
jgi:hypothetical protein